MSERGRVALIFAVVGAAAAGGGYYFFKVYQPAQEKKAAQDEITAWETRWKAARDCLMGPKPASNKTSEALAVREMLPDPWQRDTCTGLISKLTRGSAPDTGYPAIEAAWVDLDKAASKAASAFATHISAPVLDKDPLPAALDGLDAARAKLRASADLPAAAASGAALPAATLLPLSDGKDPIVSLDVEAQQLHMPSASPSAHGAVLFGKTASHDVQVDIVAGGTPHVDRVTSAELRATPDSTWGARAGAGEIDVGAFDGSGALPAPTKLPLPDEQDLTVAAAGGTLADGVVVFGGKNLVAVGHARQSAVTADSPERILEAVTGTDGDGRIGLAWLDTNREIHARIVKPGGDGPNVNLSKLLPPVPKGKFGAGIAEPPCLSNDRVWLKVTSGELFGLGGTRPTVQQPSSNALTMGCLGEGVLLREGEGAPEYRLCDDQCTPIKTTGAPDISAVTVVGGKLVAVSTHGGVLAVWRANGPAFYGLPEPLWLVYQHEWPMVAFTNGKTIDVVAHGASGYYVIRVPAN
jgi:hypothetical protein